MHAASTVAGVSLNYDLLRLHKYRGILLAQVCLKPLRIDAEGFADWPQARKPAQKIPRIGDVPPPQTEPSALGILHGLCEHRRPQRALAVDVGEGKCGAQSLLKHNTVSQSMLFSG